MRSIAAAVAAGLAIVAFLIPQAIMVADQRLGQSDDVLRLGVEQTDGLDRLAQVLFAELVANYLSQNGMVVKLVQCPVAKRASVMTPIVFWASLVPWARETSVAVPI